MSEHAISRLGRGSFSGRRTRHGQRGSALLSTMVVCLGLMGLLFATATISAVEVKESRVSVDDVRVNYLAEAGFEHGMHYLLNAIEKANASDPLRNLSDLFDGSPVITPYLGQDATYVGANQGAYTVSMTRDSQTATTMTVTVNATGYLPTSPDQLDPGEQIEKWKSVAVTVLLSLEPSEVFNYAYFINNWGWFYGSTIYANGNVRSNGQFDVAGYQPIITGQPTYQSLDSSGGIVTLGGYEDDNEDGLEDGNDGGVFSGWDIVGAQNLRGNGGLTSNQHDFQEQVEMPNLSDLGMYENLAATSGGNISIGGSSMTDEVYGDEPGERQNLYLVGTLADPIELDGPVVVRGDVLISGYVTGKGAIYAGGNVYVPESIKYVDGPSTPRPADNTQASTETWIEDNWNKDFLGLFAAENVVAGDYTDSTWEWYVSGWLASSLNKSEEDAGEDGIPNTVDGMDGVGGTADDDVLEDDGTWTVEYYSQADQDLGLIPAGKSIGDVIPGSGEDIDGDGQYDATVTVADMKISTSLDSTNWGGNVPLGGVSNYSDISSLYASQLDAVFYTNHTFAYVVSGSDPGVLNGALVSRNESIIYETPSFEINYDCRLLGGASGFAAEFLPQTISPPVILRWTELDKDPNYYAVNP